MAIDTELLWSPVLNSIKFINSEDVSFLDNQSLDDLATEEYIEFSGYCQKIQTGETRIIQFHANGTSPTAFIKNWDTDAIVDTIVASSVGTSTKETEDLTEVTFDFYEASLNFSSVGRFYVTIETNGAANEIRSEPILVGTFDDTVLIKITNNKNTLLNVWSSFVAQFRVEAQFYKLKPETEKTIFLGSDNRALILTQKNKRGVEMDIFNVPPYMHEVLGYGFSMDTIDVDGQLFYSEDGYSEIKYVDRFTLADGQAILFTKLGFGEQDFPVSLDDFLINGDGSFLVNGNGDNLING